MDLLQGAWRPRQRVALAVEREHQGVQLVIDLGVLDPGKHQHRCQMHKGGLEVGPSGDLGELLLVGPEPVVDVAHVRTGAMWLGEPSTRQRGGGLESARFLEEMGRAGDDLEPVLASQLRLCLAIEFQHHVVVTTDDEEGRGGDDRQSLGGQVGASSP